MRLERQGVAGLSQTGNSQWAASCRTSAFVRLASIKGLRTACWRGLHPRTIIAPIVEVAPLTSTSNANPISILKSCAGRNQRTLELRVQFGLAEIATVGRVLEVVGILELALSITR